MSAVATPPARTLLRERVRTAPAWLIAAVGLGALLGLSLALRSTALHSAFWIDEGLSVGISSHPLADVPSVLLKDGSPPLYYLLLSVWMSVFSDGQATTHMLSLLIALTCVPAAWWAGRSLFGVRAGWYAATLAAINPFLTYYAQETRMYALVALLSLLVAAAFVHAFVWRRRAYIVPFGVSLAALMYTHNWGLFFAVGAAVALVPCFRAAHDSRPLLRDAVLGFGLTGLLYAPWLPSLLSQAEHTGAPWSERPTVTDVFGPIVSILGGATVPLGLLLAGGAGLSAILAERGRAVKPAPGGGPVPRQTAVWVLIAMPLAALAAAWLVSQAAPAFTGRYFAILVGPLLLLSGIGLAHAGRLGVIALLIVVVLWLDPRTGQLSSKSDARAVAADIKDSVSPGDLVVSVHPESAPLLHYYFPKGLRYATSLGPMPDPRVFDWRDAQDRLQATRPTPMLRRLVATLRPGQTLILVLPIVRTARWGAPWTSLVRTRSAQWQRAADRDRNLVRLAAEPRFGHRHLPRGVRTVLYRKTDGPLSAREKAATSAWQRKS